MKKTLEFLILVVLLAALVLTALMRMDIFDPRQADTEPAAEETAESPTPVPEEPSLADPAPEDPAGPDGSTPPPTPEPTPEYFTFSAIGDCTLASHQNLSEGDKASYAGKMNGDFAYPFHNTKEYFEDDELTIANLECTLSDTRLHSNSRFYFRAPAEFAQVLTEGGVDFVTTANNHTMDFGPQGVEDTCAALDACGIPYGVEKQAQILTTPNGIHVGIYCDYNGYFPTVEDCTAAIEQLKEDGAEYIICMFHFGPDEVVYHPQQAHMDLAHACVDAGADLIYSTHSHSLQPLEVYNGAYILYGMGNWTFGGSSSPKDMDTAIFQARIKRDIDGSISNDGYEIIPCCVSSRPVLEGYFNYAYNDYCLTPYEEASELYDRAMSKILGTYDGPDGVVDYSEWIDYNAENDE